ncbi:MAG: hypothetical protein JWN52_952 [Actinomycetia bacterium]|nr:hypothetical protein [Actinomycetes bacterium]
MRHIGLLMTGVLGLAFVTANPANAAPGDTTVTFTVTAGALTITVPATKNLGTNVPPGRTVSAALGNVTVDDLRGANPAAWTAQVASSAFAATGAPTTPAIPDIPASAVTYTPGAEVSHAGDGTFTAGTAGTLSSTPRDAYTHAAGTGSSQLVWDPTLSVAVPNTAASVQYSGTVTHSVA